MRVCLVLMVLGVACSEDRMAPPSTGVAEVEREPAGRATREETPSRDEHKEQFDRMTRGAVPGEELVGFVPPELGGVARSNLLEQAFAVAAAYELESGGYINLDIKNTYRRATGSDLEDVLKKSCPKLETVGGHEGCLRAGEGRASLHWYLPDRLTVDLAAPEEALLRKSAKELPLDEIAALSANKE